MKFRIWKARVWMGIELGAAAYWRLDVPVSIAVAADEEKFMIRRSTIRSAKRFSK